MVTADTFLTDMRYSAVKTFVVELNIVIYDMCKMERAFIGKLIWQMLIAMEDIFFTQNKLKTSFKGTKMLKTKTMDF